MTKKEEQALLIFERKIFRKIYGAKYEDGERKSRTNRKLGELSKGGNIVKWIKGQRINDYKNLMTTEQIKYQWHPLVSHFLHIPKLRVMLH
jgi:hypothetical protein